jgi:hypothetical protein
MGLRNYLIRYTILDRIAHPNIRDIDANERQQRDIDPAQDYWRTYKQGKRGQR